MMVYGEKDGGSIYNKGKKKPMDGKRKRVRATLAEAHLKARVNRKRAKGARKASSGRM